MNIIDIIILAFTILLLIIGLIKGFMKQILSIGNWILALSGAFFLSNTVKSWFVGTFIEGFIYDKVFGWIDPKIADIPGLTPTNALEGLGLPKFIADFISKDLPTEGSVSEILTNSITGVLLTIVAFIITFVIILIVVKIILNLINKLFSSGVLGFINRLMGGIFGAVKALIIVCVLLFGISLLATMLPVVNEFLTAQLSLGIENAPFSIGRYLYEENPLVYIFNLVMGSA